MRKALLLTALSMAFLGVGAGSASATTFEGKCTLSGTATFSEPYTLVPTNKDYEARGKGTCTGKLDGEPYDGPAHMYLDGRMDKPMACEFGAAKDVPGVLTFGDNPDRVDAKWVDVIVNEFHIFLALPFHATGAFNGNMVGLLLFRDPTGENFQKCLAEGVTSLEFDLEGQTITPLYG
jgi:hypothetical protein